MSEDQTMPTLDLENLADLEKKVERDCFLLTYQGKDRIVSSDTLRADLEKEDRSFVHVFSTGIFSLDAAVGKLESGELIAIGGPTKHGKTSLAQTLTANLARAGANCLWFTFEVPPRQFLAQMPPEFRFYLPRELTLSKTDWVRERIEEAVLKFKTRIIFIDNLHHLFDIAVSRNPSLDIGNIIRLLKRTAVEFNVVIFLLCHSRKPTEFKGEVQECSEWDLRDSSFVPQESDSTWMIQRKMDPSTKIYSQEALLKVCNHRRTGAMGVKVHLIKTGPFLEEDVAHYSN